MSEHQNDADPSEEDYDFDEEIGEDGTLYLLFTCPACKRRLKESLRDKEPGDEIVCPCGETKIDLQGDPGGAQEMLDGIERSIEDAFKRTGFKKM